MKDIKSNLLQSHFFHQLCEDNNEEYEHLALHSEVFWLSKENHLYGFVVLWNSFFKKSITEDNMLQVKINIFYLSNIIEKLNMFNNQFQEKNSN